MRFQRAKPTRGKVTGDTVHAQRVLPVRRDRNLDDRAADPDRWAILLDLVRRLEAEPALLGASPHLLGTGYRPTLE